MKKLLKIYQNKNLILDEETKDFFEMFLFLYFNWLRKNNHLALEKLSELLEIEKFSEINNLTKLTVNANDFKIVKIKELLESEGYDEDVLFDIRDSISEYKILSKEDMLFNDVYLESFFNIIDSIENLTKMYDELIFMNMLFKKIIKVCKKINFENLSEKKSIEIKKL